MNNHISFLLTPTFFHTRYFRFTKYFLLSAFSEKNFSATEEQHKKWTVWIQIILNHHLKQSACFHLNKQPAAAAGACFTNFLSWRALLVFIKFPCICTYSLAYCTQPLLPSAHSSCTTLMDAAKHFKMSEAVYRVTRCRHTLLSLHQHHSENLKSHMNNMFMFVCIQRKNLTENPKLNQIHWPEMMFTMMCLILKPQFKWHLSHIFLNHYSTGVIKNTA
jgi:hypothetical protein